MKKIPLILFILMLMAFGAQAGQKELSHDGRLRLYVYHVDEFLTIQYLDQDDQWIDEAYQKINHLLRSRGDDKVTQMDKRLIVLADHLQDHFKADTVEVISAYRSPGFNKQLKEDGRNVANESLHTKGLAMDIHIDEIDEADLRDYLLSLGRGGVGYYGDRLMVHMDFGPVRQWHGGNYRDNLGIGLFNKKSPVKITTDKLFYGAGSTMKLKFTGVKKNVPLNLEKFHRGKWTQTADFAGDTIQISKIINKLKNISPYGKFRFRYKKGDDWQNSNEFYVKK